MKRLINGAMTAVTMVGITAYAAEAAPVTINVQSPAIVAEQAMPAPSFYLERVTHMADFELALELGETSVSMEEAAQIGVDALIKYFEADLDGVTIHMVYLPAFEEFGVAATWRGSIMPKGSEYTLYEAPSRYSFAVYAETGELHEVSFNPESYSGENFDAINEILSNSLEIPAYSSAIPLNQSEDYARHGMDIAYELGIFEGGIARSKRLQLSHELPTAFDINLDFVTVATILVECVDGNIAAVQFETDTKELRRVIFHADLAEWATIFDWVNR